jgi:hypothetical protein
MDEADRDTLMRMAAFEHVRRASASRSSILSVVYSSRNRCGFLLSIKTVFPKPGGKVWYDDQREVHRQIFEEDYLTLLTHISQISMQAHPENISLWIANAVHPTLVFDGVLLPICFPNRKIIPIYCHQ